jgi:geranylgeranyl reductase family protein
MSVAPDPPANYHSATRAASSIGDPPMVEDACSRSETGMSATNAWDVVVVGAGPAGSTLARLLAARGLRVALLDRARFPRDKVCGGGLSRKTLRLLPVTVTERCTLPVSGAILAFQNCDHREKPLTGEPGGAVIRREFDAALVEQAEHAGAALFEESPLRDLHRGAAGWEVAAGTTTFRSRLVVGADGVFSQVRRRVFGDGAVEYTPAVEACVVCDAATLERFRGRLLFDLGGMRNGYGWIFPKADHLNVGVYSMFRARSIRDEFRRFIRMYPLLGAAAGARVLGHAIPVRNATGAFERDGCLLIGDAGGFAEAFYGEGIFYAIRSAECAARAIPEMLQHGTSGVFSRIVRQELGAELRYSLRNARLFFTRPAVAYRVLVGNAMTTEWFAQLIHGGLTHRGVFWRTTLGAPIWGAFGGRTAPLRNAGWLRA